MFVMHTVDDLWDHIAYVLGYAPDRFPYRDFLPDDQQMTLGRAFEQLHEGIAIAYPEARSEQKRQELHAILDQSHAAYRSGEEIAAGKFLNEFESQIFKR
ncbi:hypothetical protein [Sphingobium sp. YR768]|uniref:hypothetical protein n=1 Tax=Sphingobium sp. YR768 TaxID=1884365 RepID=UPI0008AF0E41|nr:hypothetical protein [Sphingobium sp. YR768]SEQ47933.1 hypothetical protein SAMN05518866_10166 [Sphingobium sp. YR768]